MQPTHLLLPSGVQLALQKAVKWGLSVISLFLLPMPVRLVPRKHHCLLSDWHFFFIFLSLLLFFQKKNNLQFGINQLKGHLVAQSFQKLNPNKCDMVVFVTVFLSQIRYAVSYCYCNLPPLYMLLGQDTINTIYDFRQWVDGRVISHFIFLLTLFSLCSLA